MTTPLYDLSVVKTKRIAELEARCAELEKQLAEATDKLRKWGYAEDANRQLQIAREKLAENERISELHRQREMECIAKWQAENKSPHLQPDYGRLLDWLHEQLLEKDAQLEKAREAWQNILVTCGESLIRDAKLWVSAITQMEAALSPEAKPTEPPKPQMIDGMKWANGIGATEAAMANDTDLAGEVEKPQMMICPREGKGCRECVGVHPRNNACDAHGCVPVEKKEGK